MSGESITRVVARGSQTDADPAIERAPAPVQVGRYVVHAQLGRGGGGVVYAAWDPELDRDVAVKLLHAGGRAPEAERARLLREAQALAQISDPNVVPVYDVGVDADTGAVFLVMARIVGEDLKSWLSTPREVGRILAMFAGAARGLVAAHRCGVLHRDFKPANVLVGKGPSGDGEWPMLGDFGLARGHDGPPSSSPPTIAPESVGSLDGATLTAEGTVVGTPTYMAPEQHLAEAVGPAADQYAFCASLFAGLCGRPPFAGRDPGELLAAKLAGVRMPSPPPAGVPHTVLAAIERGLAANPAARHRDMQAVLAVLERAIHPGRARMWLAAGAAIAGATAIAIMVAPKSSCRGGEEKIAALWNDDARTRTRDALAHGGAAYEIATGDAAVLRIDGLVGDWTRAWADTCQRAAELGDVAFDDRVHCLDRARAGLGNAIDVLQSGGDDIARHAVAVLDRVPVASRCDVDRDPELGDLPRDPALREQIELERARLDRAELLSQAARLDEAAALANEVAAAAEQIGFRPLLARALLVRASVEGMRSDPLTAVRELERAALLASELGLDEAAALAEADLAFRYAYDLRKPDEGERWLEHAEVSDARTGGTALGPAALLDVRAAVALGRGDYPRARVMLEQAVEQSEGAPKQGEYLSHLGVVANILGDHDAAATFHHRARAVNEQRFGLEHPMVAYDWGNEGSALRSAGREDEAVKCFERELTLLERAMGPDHPEVAIALTHEVETLSHRGDHAQALAIADRICAINLRARGEDHVAYAQALYGRAEVLLALARDDDAAADLRKSIAIAERALGPEHADLVLLWRGLAQALRKDHPFEAIAALERGLAIFAVAPSDPNLRETMESMLTELRAR